jgi:hypothetical protein
MRRPAPILVPALVMTALTLPAQAEPVAQSRLALVSFTLTADDETAQRVSLTVTSATHPRLTLQVSDCDASGCAGIGYYETRLAPSAVRLDPDLAAGELKTVLDGRKLHVAWTPDERPVVMAGTQGSSDGDSETLTVYRADPARVQVTFDGGSCTTSGGVGDELRLENPEGAAGNALPLSAFRPARDVACEPA